MNDAPSASTAPHFTPRDRPRRRRIAFIPDGDLLQAIRDGKAAVVTDEIERFTETGLLLKSGAGLEADIIVTATGFHLSVLGDIAFAIDGKKHLLPKHGAKPEWRHTQDYWNEKDEFPAADLDDPLFVYA